ncbi:MAG: hypothetical protein J6W23_02840 [Victivallales bacterium]|nr:hypothetical protein [Victivallales bacterium]
MFLFGYHAYTVDGDGGWHGYCFCLGHGGAYGLRGYRLIRIFEQWGGMSAVCIVVAWWRDARCQEPHLILSSLP